MSEWKRTPTPGEFNSTHHVYVLMSFNVLGLSYETYRTLRYMYITLAFFAKSFSEYNGGRKS